MATADPQALSTQLLENIYAIPNGEKLKECLQCGTCSASCPSSAAMDYGPREIIASLRAGMSDRVLNSNTVWLCVSCYSCVVRCPARASTMAKAFVETVDQLGRNAETTLLRKYFLRTNPWKALKQIPLAMRLFLRGRLEIFPRKIRGVHGLRRMMAAIEDNEPS